MTGTANEALWTAVALLAILTAILLVAPYLSTSIDEANLPIEGRAKFIVAKDVVSYGTAGNPPCLEIHDSDCITSYEYSINARDGNVYRLDTKQFPVRIENNTDPLYASLSRGGVVAVRCDHMSRDSKDNPLNKNMQAGDSWTITVSDRNLFFGCEVEEPTMGSLVIMRSS